LKLPGHVVSGHFGSRGPFEYILYHCSTFLFLHAFPHEGQVVVRKCRFWLILDFLPKTFSSTGGTPVED
jgi:hypothetical protein